MTAVCHVYYNRKELFQKYRKTSTVNCSVFLTLRRSVKPDVVLLLYALNTELSAFKYLSETFIILKYHFLRHGHVKPFKLLIYQYCQIDKPFP